MTPAYMWLVKHEYDLQSSNGSLPGGLISPSTKSIREECIRCYESGCAKKDEAILMSFLNLHESEGLGSTLNSYDFDKFKPVVNFLNGKTTNPSYKVVALVSWLIDFPDRPYNRHTDYDNAKEKIQREKEIAKNQASTKTEEEPQSAFPKYLPLDKPIETLGQVKQKKEYMISVKRFALSAFILSSLGSFLYLMGKQQINRSIAYSCMYWSYDHYEAVPCDFKSQGIFVIALDTFKQKYFRRIITKDTITYASIGVLWYAKPKRDSVEFYTAEGFHPVDHYRRLKPLTKYMIDKYILKKQKGDPTGLQQSN